MFHIHKTVIFNKMWFIIYTVKEHFSCRCVFIYAYNYILIRNNIRAPKPRPFTDNG